MVIDAENEYFETIKKKTPLPKKKKEKYKERARIYWTLMDNVSSYEIANNLGFRPLRRSLCVQKNDNSSHWCIMRNIGWKISVFPFASPLYQFAKTTLLQTGREQMLLLTLSECYHNNGNDTWHLFIVNWKT